MDAKQTVTAAEVVIEEPEGPVLGQSNQPDGELGEFDCQRVQIDAIEAAFCDEAASDDGTLLDIAGQLFDAGVASARHPPIGMN
ncbi:hypothetical protein D3C71_1590890 [compost metagenome]